MIAVPDTLNTPRLRLRRPKPGDASAAYQYGADPEVVRYMDWPALTSPEDAIEATERALRRWEAGEEYAWRITIKPEDNPVGGVACSIEAQQAEFGFLLARPVWGKGYATEAARAVLDWLVSLPQVQRIRATCDVDNTASARVLQKLGMTHAGLLPKQVRRPNLPGAPVRDAIAYFWVRAA